MMRILFFLLFCALLFVFTWDAFREPPLAPANIGARAIVESSTGVTYFLIDTSGSMAKVDAEAAVSKILDPLALNDASALVSRTYFRAANEEACRAPVKIATPVAASESVAEPQTFQDDFTPTGEALKAAILQAVKGGVPATINLVSDEEQTPGCGVDVCRVASALLPIEGITVRSIPVFGTSSINHDRFGCIEAAQRNWETANVSLDTTGEERGTGVKPATFFEKWTWLLLFGIVALSALSIGFTELKRSINLSEKIDNARSLRSRIEKKDEKAKGELKELRKGEPDLLRAESDGDGAKGAGRQIATNWRKVRRWFAASIFALKFWYIWFGGVGLLILSLGNEDLSLPNYRLRVAQASAWTVLDTNFATAFAVTWIALIFFWGTQYKGRKEAEHRLLLATDEAKHSQRIEEAENLARAHRNYASAFEDINDLELYAPWYRSNHNEDEGAALANFELVRGEAITVALRDYRLSNEPTLDEVKQKTNLLKEMKPRFVDRHNFEKFAAMLSAKGLFKDHNNEWSDLLAILSSKDRTDDRIRGSVRLLAEKLQTAGT